ncbi:type I-C CRISPR-associated endonuclease Cas1c [Akkermansia glycaniphila]|uniref:CRISPR-associated endonuclease Cas1 n=1 Tax=Akkermansia glycaniphila TaxID=1679444 RepID=A0A1C7PDU9_9BACT|nr:type I-C CRISPR-associated endonuclease Cas1c [Akkermansia glycaniphila]OCA02212.1 CRISPR-associated protein Cas1 [Akkermansia glycaniphila]SEH99113.1 cas1 dvulg: crispr-associated endonuclease cas1 subtype i-c/dvulg [Akkermansia glycaniphila]
MKQHLNTLYVTREGVWLAKDGETVSIIDHGSSLMRVPLHNLESIITMGWDIGVSPQLLAACAASGIRLSFCDPNGRFLAAATGFTPGNVLLRRAQYRCADQPEAALNIAREMIAAKILNARHVLLRVDRDRSGINLEPVISSLAYSVQAARKARDAAELLGIEGNAADAYFSAFPTAIAHDDPAFIFCGRSRRPPRDSVNALMSFVYALLAHDCRSALESCGLDAAVGVLHRDRPGRPGLALDLMEEFRAVLDDRLVLTLINRRQIKPGDFTREESGAVFLKEESRKIVLSAWQERKKETIMHPVIGEKITIGLLPHIQARLLARHLRGDVDAYTPMLWR